MGSTAVESVSFGSEIYVCMYENPVELILVSPLVGCDSIVSFLIEIYVLMYRKWLLYVSFS